MIEPPPAAFIASTEACMPRNVPVRLTSMTFCHLAMSNLPILPSATMPALLTSTLSLPNSVDRGGDGGLPLVGLGDVEVDVARGLADLVGQRLALVVEDVADDHFGALGDQHPGVRGAHPPCPAADQCNFSVHASHDGSGYRMADFELEHCSNSLDVGTHTAGSDIRHEENEWRFASRSSAPATAAAWR